ncbi:MAG: succinate dehydrogenase/fumarate reductase iron-sulfur subunit [Elusimicrobia bacterium]|nr:succinate dehydrogenase/fumarate reductase iron-sulfur subunit [Elusimicrobiota bacterium]MDE2236494.1 succinate dehydrogenase/fumarate reductase iron-sulfur subunit [Elusimicrobiota bacterium]MDE2424600.1 succinate dehydrogenase/fumarate reductase iron-sulfur subunit [Elusimicrobiota bacterium]
MSEKAKRSYTLKVWRQRGPKDKGRFAQYQVSGISPDASFLEMLDVLNEELIKRGEPVIAFDSDCREGICGMCSCVINGQPHGPDNGSATCELHMRRFEDGSTITVEPFRARAFPPVKDLVVDRSAFDRIIASGGYVSINAGNAPDGNALAIGHDTSEKAMDAAACIGCGACVAACPNAAAMLFVSAKVSHLALLPQGQPERDARALAMSRTMDEAGFGNCSNEYECEAACPKEIKVSHIALLNREFLRASLK